MCDSTEALDKLEELQKNFRTTEKEIDELKRQISANERIFESRDRELQVQIKSNEERQQKLRSLTESADQKIAKVNELDKKTNSLKAEKDIQNQKLYQTTYFQFTHTMIHSRSTIFFQQVSLRRNQFKNY